MTKRRCASCKEYFESFYYMDSVMALCSEKCFNANTKKVYSKSNMIPTETRRLVNLRDKVCKLCGSIKRLHIHHVYYRSEASPDWKNDPSNLILLCEDCHQNKVHVDKKKYQPMLLDILSDMGYSDPKHNEEED